MEFTRILVPTDFSELSCDAVRLALEIGRSDDAVVTLYHVVEYDEVAPHYGVLIYEFTPKSERPVLDLIEQRKRLLAAFLGEKFTDLLPHVKVHCAVEVGRPYRKILERAESRHRADRYGDSWQNRSSPCIDRQCHRKSRASGQLSCALSSPEKNRRADPDPSESMIWPVYLPNRIEIGSLTEGEPVVRIAKAED